MLKKKKKLSNIDTNLANVPRFFEMESRNFRNLTGGSTGCKIQQIVAKIKKIVKISGSKTKVR